MTTGVPPSVSGAPSEPWRGGQLTPRVRCLLAPNPGPMTLDGTNTYVLAEPGSAAAVVVDPGPEDERHVSRLLQDVDNHGQHVVAVLLTHGHADHSAAAAGLARRWACPVRAVDPAYRLGPEGLVPGERIVLAGTEVDVVATPGHTGDSVCLHVPDDRVVLTGDTVLGRGTTVVAHPDGVLADYLRSLETLERLAADTPELRLLPGHGPAGAPLAQVVAAYRQHRAARLDQVVDAVAAGAAHVDGVVEHVYADVHRTLWPAARLSVQAQVDYLVGTGALRAGPTGLSARDA